MEQQKKSTLRSLWRYVRTKSRNALWVMRTKGLAGVWRNIKSEILFLSGRYKEQQGPPQVQTEASPPKKVPDSAFENRRKVLPANCLPIRARLEPWPELTVDRDAVGQTIRRLKEELRRSATPPGQSVP